MKKLVSFSTPALRHMVAEAPVADPVSVSSPVNRRSHIPRLGLARALSRSADTQDQAQQLYQEVISMAPGVSCELLHLDFSDITSFTPTQLCDCSLSG